MNYLKFISIFLVLLLVVVVGCDNKDTKTTVDKRDTSRVTDKDAAGNKDGNLVTIDDKSGSYFCTMHPMHQSDNEAAKCAICKMKLTNKDKYNETVDKKVDEMKEKIKDKDNMAYEEFKVARYRSDECEKFITSAVNKSGSVTDVYIDKLEPSVHVVYDKSKTDKDIIEDAITAAGFDPKDADKNTAVKLPDDCYEKSPGDKKDTADTVKKR